MVIFELIALESEQLLIRWCARRSSDLVFQHFDAIARVYDQTDVSAATNVDKDQHTFAESQNLWSVDFFRKQEEFATVTKLLPLFLANSN